ncbi:DUF2892 domain-containing protein, partial [Pseudomonas syringae pv. tagetis]
RSTIERDGAVLYNLKDDAENAVNEAAVKGVEALTEPKPVV